MKSAARLANTAVGHARNFYRNSTHAADAREGQKNIVQALPDRALEPALRKEIKTYATKHFGSKAFAPWLETYAAWRGEFVEGCLPDNYHNQYVVPHAMGPHVGTLRNTLARRILETDRLPDIGYILHGRLYDVDAKPVDITSFQRAAFAKHPHVYVKAAKSLQGLGVQRASANNLAQIVAKTKNAVIQYPVEVHPDLAALSYEAATTIRITTVLDKDGPRPVASFLRTGRPSETHIKADTEINFIVAIETGDVAAKAMLGKWQPISRHPDTGAPFQSVRIPAFDEMKAQAVELHARIPQYLYLGWDATVTPSSDIMF
ncbi:MAG: hypothetical protein HKP37_10645, partial [Boseongicola sp.]|nr:hypothetical protein [Boseongicola sp.]